MRITLIAILTLTAVSAHAQHSWTVQQCMQYAVAHNHEVKRTELELDNYMANRTGAIGRYLPKVDMGIGAQYNFGRTIDPETNIYTDVSTFNNGYSLSASFPFFDGFNRLHALKAAKASVLMGHHALRQKQNQIALNVLQAFVNVAYYDGLVKMAGEKMEETTLLLRQTRLLEELGRKSAADVAQVESQQAEANYELTHQQNLLASAILELKKSMAYPMGDTIRCEIPILSTDNFHAGNKIFPNSEQYIPTLGNNPELLASHYQMKASKHEWHQSRASLFPSLSLSAGLNTTARENYEQKQLELEKLAREAWQDWQVNLKQTEQMLKKVEADSLTYHLTRRQFEEGLSTAIDLHPTSSQLLKSKATLLQCQLMAMVKEQLVRYYNGQTIWTE